MRKAVIQFEAVMKIACVMPTIEKEDEADIIRLIEEGDLVIHQVALPNGNRHWALMPESELDVPDSRKQGIPLEEVRSMFLLADSKGVERARPKLEIVDTTIPDE